MSSARPQAATAPVQCYRGLRAISGKCLPRAARQLLEIVQARFDAGAATAVELVTQKAAYDTAQIAIPELEQARKERLAGLALLLGRPPENFKLASGSLDSLVEPPVAAGLPSELLARRPDVWQAEANLRAGHGDLQAARAAMFPSLSLAAAADRSIVR